MDGLFISYRRHDASGHAGRLRDHLRARYGQRVFQDVDDIPDGEIFEQVLGRALATCHVGLVVIGPRWLDEIDAAGRRRVDAPDDWVHTEIRLLLERAIRVIPVLVGGASMPTADSLPGDLKSLAKRQARELRDSSWDADVNALIKGLDDALGKTQPPDAAAKPALRRRLAWIAAALVVVLVLGAGGFYWSPSESDKAGPSSVASEYQRATDPAPTSSSPDLTRVLATALGLPGTLWIRDTDPPKAFEFVVRDGAVLLQSTGNAAQERMLVRQIQGRAITLVDQPRDGGYLEYMFVFELANDGSTLDKCQTLRISNGGPVGHCSLSFRRAERGPRRGLVRRGRDEG